MRWTLWDEMRRMQDQMDRMFDGLFDYEPARGTELLAGPGTALSDYRQPVADIWETDNEVVATVELPGVDKKDIQINATEDGVDIKVEKKEEKRQEDKKGYVLERSYSGFYRRFSVPENIDPDKIRATYNNGVLEMRMPKVEKEKRKGRQIKVD